MRYYLRKLIGLLITLILVSLLTFLVFQVLPGDPALIILGPDADAYQLEALRASLNLDMSPLMRYLSWVRGLFSGDLGTSIRYGLRNTQTSRNPSFNDAFGLTAALNPN